MQFKFTWEKVLDGSKTQTRRIRFPYDLAVQLWKYDWNLPWEFTWSDDRQQALIKQRYIESANILLKKHCITLPIIPGRRKRSVGRIHVINVRWEWLQDIDIKDIYAEGIEPAPLVGREATIMMERYAFAALWDDINKKPGTRFADGPRVFAFTFKLVNKNGMET